MECPGSPLCVRSGQLVGCCRREVVQQGGYYGKYNVDRWQVPLGCCGLFYVFGFGCLLFCLFCLVTEL